MRLKFDLSGSNLDFLAGNSPTSSLNIDLARFKRRIKLRLIDSNSISVNPLGNLVFERSSGVVWLVGHSDAD